jgi:hypothetical protein
MSFMRYVGRHRAPRPLYLRRPVVAGIVGVVALGGPALAATQGFSGDPRGVRAVWAYGNTQGNDAAPYAAVKNSCIDGAFRFIKLPRMEQGTATRVVVQISIVTESTKSNSPGRLVKICGSTGIVLSGADMEIQPSSEKYQTLSDVAPSEWSWLVTPNDSGSQQLAVNIYAQPGGASSPITIDTIDASTQVSFNFTRFLQSVWAQALAVGLGSIAAAVLFVYHRARRRIRPKEHVSNIVRTPRHPGLQRADNARLNSSSGRTAKNQHSGKTNA